MANKKYSMMRVRKEDVEELKRRIERINKEDLRNIGLKKHKVNMIDITGFLFRTPIFISNNELKTLVRRKGGRLC